MQKILLFGKKFSILNLLILFFLTFSIKNFNAKIYADNALHHISSISLSDDEGFLYNNSLPGKEVNDKKSPKKEVSREVTLKMKNDVNYLMVQFAAVLNTRNDKKIKDFISFYFDNNARIIKHTTLFDPYIPGKELDHDEVNINKEQYVKYITTLVKSPLEYAISAKVDQIKMLNRFNIIANISLKEVAISEIKLKKNSEKNDKVDELQKNLNSSENRSKIKTLVDTKCNFIMRASATIVIEGINCIEKIVVY